MHTQTPSADVCTTKRPRRTAAPKLPYPDLPEASALSVEFWTAAVQRDEAELVAFEVFRAKVNRQAVRQGKEDRPLEAALYRAERLLHEDLERSRKHLANAQKRAEVPA